MNRIWIVLAALLWVLPAQAQFKSGARFGDANGFSAPMAASGGGGCSQATTALAALSGLTGPQTTAYTTMICAMVTNGDWNNVESLYVASTSLANSLVNLKNPGTGNLTNTGTATFSNPGWTGNGTSQYLLGYTLGSASLGSIYTRNSASYGFCVLNNRTAQTYNVLDIGVVNSGGNSYTQLNVRDNTGAATGDINGQTYLHYTTASGQGSWGMTRTTSSATAIYHSGASVATSAADTSQSLATVAFAVLAQNNNGTIGAWVSDTVGYAWFGNASVSQSNMYTVLHTFITDASIGGGAC